MKYRVLIPLFLFYLSYRLIFWGVDPDKLLNVLLNAIADTAVAYSSALGIYSLTFNKGFQKKWIQILTILLCFLLSSGLLWLLHLFLYQITGGMNPTFQTTFDRLTFQFFDVVSLLFIGNSVSFSWFKHLESKNKSILNQKLEEEKRISELKFLKSQINPHFIFNTLNAINFSIHKENLQARSLISDFADLFRFQLYESDLDYILLEKELGFIKKYIRIHEVRMSETFKVDLQEEGEVSNKLIPPLLLIPFIENAFKHANPAMGDKNLILVMMDVKRDQLHFSVKNTKGTIAIKKETGGVGLSNVKKRMEILFPQMHQMEIKNESDYFEINLKIPLKV